MGLGRIFIFAVIFGISISFSYRFGGDITNSGLSFYFVDSLAKSFGPSIQALALVGSIGLGIVSIFSMAKTFGQIYENKLSGIIVLVLGFSGSVLIILSPQGNFQVILIGLGFWIIDIILVKKLNSSIKK